MPLVRSRVQGEEVAVVHAGRRLRIRNDWIGVSDQACKKLLEAAGELLEVKGREAERVPRIEELDAAPSSVATPSRESDSASESEAEPAEQKKSGSKFSRKKKASEEE